jgi:hypothetical protein
MPSLTDDRKEALHHARKDFEAACETLDRATGDASKVDAYRIARASDTGTIRSAQP